MWSLGGATPTGVAQWFFRSAHILLCCSLTTPELELPSSEEVEEERPTMPRALASTSVASRMKIGVYELELRSEESGLRV